MSKPEDVRALIARARELVSNASPAPWAIDNPQRGDDQCDGIKNARGDLIVETDSGVYGPGMADATLMVEARNALVPQLANACEQLLDLVRRLQWGSCDGCGGSGFCPKCERPKEGWNDEPPEMRGKHAPDCPLAALGLPAEDE